MKKLLLCLCFISFLFCSADAQKTRQPNIILILTDDMGYGDISCYNGTYKTPNIDRLASEGIRFTNYYSASPICSPSRAGILTGMQPARWNFTSFLDNKKHNKAAEQVNFLDPKAPSIARILKEAGYATGHFGKWHMGGGRDVKDAPGFAQYGFDQWNSTYESPDPDPLLTATNWIWSEKDSIKRWDRTAYFVDKTLEFLKQNSGKPCYINLWPDDVHTPWVAGDRATGRYPGNPEEEKSFVNVLKEYDRQMGRLMEGLKKLGIDENTIVIFTSDNGPLPNFRQDRSADMRGSKLSLYEGGIRLPFIVRWPAKIKGGLTDTASVLSAHDLLPTFCSLAGIKVPPGFKFDGLDKKAVLSGQPSKAKRTLYWEYGRNNVAFNYPGPKNRSPAMAIREGNWKFLMNADGSSKELYDLSKDKPESKNLAAEYADLVSTFADKLQSWWKSLPVIPQP
ncbi:MAG: sulfatase-like hydrolase/transferase [Bacteroidota bacterium]